MAANPREELIAYLAKLSDQEVGKLLKFAQSLHDEEILDLSPDYDPDNDPSVGFFSGPPDLAEKAEEILWEGFGLPKNETEEPNP